MRILPILAAAALALSAAAVPAGAAPLGPFASSRIETAPAAQSVRCWWRRGTCHFTRPRVWVGPRIQPLPRAYFAPAVRVGPGIYLRTVRAQ